MALKRILQARSVTPDHEHHALHRCINNEEAEIHSARCLSLSSRKPSSFVLSGPRWSYRGRAERGLDRSGHLATVCQARCPATKTPHIHRSTDRLIRHHSTISRARSIRQYPSVVICGLRPTTRSTHNLRHSFLIRRDLQSRLSYNITCA
jgi:hypothetical protein